MSASIYAPGVEATANSNASIIPESFTATAGQTLFTLTQFLYAIGTNSLWVFVNGVFQRSGIDYTETSTSSFTFVSGLTVGDTVIAIGMVAIAGTGFGSVLTTGLTFSPDNTLDIGTAGDNRPRNIYVGTGINIGGLTVSSAVATDASKNLISVTNTGTGNNVLSASPTFTGTITAAAITGTTITGNAFVPASSSVPTNGMFLPAANSVGFATNSAEKLRLDASGNLGSGVTPSAWTTTFKMHQFGQSGVVGAATSGNTTYFASNFYNAGAGNIYIANGLAGLYQIVDGEHQWLTAASGTAGGTVSFATNMQLLNVANNRYLKASSNGTYAGSSSAYHELNQATANQFTLFAFNNHASTPFGYRVQYPNASPNGTSNEFIYGDDSGGQRFSFRSNGGLANYSANDANLSDIEAKSEIEQITISHPIAADLWTAHRDTDWGRYKYKDQTHDDWNYGPTVQGVERAFAATVPALITEWEPTVEKEFTGSVEIDGLSGDYSFTKKVANTDGYKALYHEDLKSISQIILSHAQIRIERLEAALKAANIPL
jgi:hypothetical protein